MKVAYFVHDATDAAVERRVRMLRAAKVEVGVLAFRRSASPVAKIGETDVFDLGRTHDAQFAHRVGSVLRWSARPNALRKAAGDADIFIARNLEMLALAVRARRAAGRAIPIVYECLDIHRLMLASGPAGRAARAVERRLLAQTQLLIVSTPTFISEYFEPVHGIDRMGLSSMVVENKVLELQAPRRTPSMVTAGGGLLARRPWRIGWFGVLRCEKSLNILTALAVSRPDLVEVVIRGRPTTAVFEDFEAAIEGVGAIRFGGAYRPDEVEQLYRSTHFTWAIDYFDEGKNSSWLLPNRLYEGGLHHSVPIALRDVEAGRWLSRRRLGVLVDDPLRDLEAFLEGLEPATYRAMAQRVATADRTHFRADLAECARLARSLAALQPSTRPIPWTQSPLPETVEARSSSSPASTKPATSKAYSAAC